MTSDHPEAVPGLPLEVHGHANAATLLLWHPAARTDAGRVARIASRLAGAGHRVVVPAWSDARDLLRSIRYARETAVHPPDQLRVVGYDAGGIAALSLALHQRRLGIGLTEAVCIGAAGEPDPISGRPLPDPAAPQVATRIVIQAGATSESAAWSRRTSALWRAAGWPVEVEPGASAPDSDTSA